METLLLGRINRCSAYVVWPEIDGFHFRTDHGLEMSVSFDRDSFMEGIIAYWFNLTNRSNAPSPNDPKVQQTIVCIIEEFFRVNPSVLLYMCDTANSQQAARSRLFLRWFHEADKRGRYVIKSAMIRDEEQENYIALIIQRSNPDHDAIVQFFDEEVQLFKANKPGNTEC